MQFFKSAVSSLLIFSVPAAAIPSIPLPFKEPLLLSEETSIPTYEDLLAYIERIENEDLEAICHPQDLNRLNLFMVQLAKAGLLSEEGEEAEELYADIQDLLAPEETSYAFAYTMDGRTITPTIFSGDSYQTTLCKSWIKKTYKKIKKFVKKHKTEILVGAAVVVTVVVVVVTVGTGTGAGAAAVAGAAASAAESSEHPKEHTKETKPTVQEVIDEHISDFKEAIAEEIPPRVAANATTEFLGETIRKMGASLAHETLNGVAAVVSAVPALVDEVSNFSQKTGLYSQIDDSTLFSSISALEHFKEMTKTGHEYIDSAFSTQMAEKYSLEGKTSGLCKEDMKIGIIPIFPGSCGSIPLTGRIAPTQANSVRGWSVGQDIRNLTADGKVPKWRAVRSRYWKNERELVKLHPKKYIGDIKSTPENIKRMERGLAPKRKNTETGELESLELHHDPSQREGGLFDFIEVWPDEHAAIDKYRKIGK